jgi:hypothetical protein
MTSVELGFAQVIFPVLPGSIGAGFAVSVVTDTLALPVFPELVPVTVYVPAVLTVTLDPVAVKLLGPVQLYVVVPEAVVLAVMVTVGLVQPITPE